MAKKKEFVEGIDYVITIRKRKKFIKNPKKNICPICENCNHKNLCLNRRNKETMERCKKCKNCSDYENCDKFHFYNEYEGRLLKLGINANTGKAIRQSFSGKSEEIVLEKLKKQFLKNKEEGIKETIYTPNQTSIIDLAYEIEENKLKIATTHAPGYNRNMQSIKACSAYNFMLKPIQNVTRTEIERFLQSERHKSNSSISKEYRIIKNAFKLAQKRHLIDNNFDLDFNIDPVEKPKSYKEDKDVVAFTLKEEYTLIQYMNTHYNEYNNMLLLSLYTGMRIGEVLALTTNDFDFDEKDGTIFVNKTLTQNTSRKTIVGKVTKTKKNSYLSINIEELELRFPTPIYLVLGNMNEQVQNAQQMAEFITTTYYPEDPTGQAGLGYDYELKKASFKKKIYKKHFLPSLEWDSYDEIFKEVDQEAMSDGIEKNIDFNPEAKQKNELDMLEEDDY